MAFFGIMLANIVFMILLFTACGLVIAGVVLALMGVRASKKGNIKRGRALKLIGGICLAVVVAAVAFLFREMIFPERLQLQTPAGIAYVKEYDCMSLRRAIHNEDGDEIKRLISNDPQLLYYIFAEDERDISKGKTLIGYTLSERYDESTIALLELGAEPDEIYTEDTEDGAVSLFIENCDIYCSSWEIEMIGRLVDHGADINKTADTMPPIQFIIGSMYIGSAAPSHEDMLVLEKCLKAGADVSAENEDGQNAAEFLDSLEGGLWTDEDVKAVRDLLKRYEP